MPKWARTTRAGAKRASLGEASGKEGYRLGWVGWVWGCALVWVAVCWGVSLKGLKKL